MNSIYLILGALYLLRLADMINAKNAKAGTKGLILVLSILSLGLILVLSILFLLSSVIVHIAEGIS